MISEQNGSLRITLSKKQINWLETVSKKLRISKSRLVKFLIQKNLRHLYNYITPEQMEEIIRIAKTPWLDQEDDE